MVDHMEKSGNKSNRSVDRGLGLILYQRKPFLTDFTSNLSIPIGGCANGIPRNSLTNVPSDVCWKVPNTVPYLVITNGWSAWANEENRENMREINLCISILRKIEGILYWPRFDAFLYVRSGTSLFSSTDKSSSLVSKFQKSHFCRSIKIRVTNHGR